VKAGFALASESLCEDAVIQLAEVAERVVALSVQSVRVRYEVAGVRHVAYPDLTLLGVDGRPELWEVKPRGGLKPEKLNRLVALTFALRQAGVSYLVRQPHWFGRQPRLRNALALRGHTAGNLDPAVKSKIALAFASGGSRRLSDIMSAAKLSFADAFGCIASGWLAADIGTTELSSITPVRPAHPRARSGAYDLTPGKEL
jgi:hypothetical protein